MRVCDNLRKEYSMVKLMDQEIEKKKKEIELLEHLKKESVKAIRNTYREQERYANEFPDWKPYGEGYDSRYLRKVYDFVFTEEDCEEYKDAEWEHWYNPWGDGRDCTGVWFTRNIDIFPLPKCGKTIVYHFQDCDI